MERQTNETIEVELGGEEIQDEVQIDNEQYVNDEQNVNDGPDVIGVVPLRRSLRQITPPVRFQVVFPDTFHIQRIWRWNFGGGESGLSGKGEGGEFSYLEYLAS